MPNQNINKIIYGGRTLIDLTSDTVEPSTLLKGSKAHDKTGAVIEGTCSFDVDSRDATAKASELLQDTTAYVNGNKITGSMPNNGSIELFISSVFDQIDIPYGFHDGGGRASIEHTVTDTLKSENIREGISILGITGSMSGSENMKPQAKTIVPKATKQTIVPDLNFNCLSQVEVDVIPYVETANQAGGLTVTIAG